MAGGQHVATCLLDPSFSTCGLLLYDCQGEAFRKLVTHHHGPGVQRLGARLLVSFCTLGSTVGSPKLKALGTRSILLTGRNSITWDND